MTLIDASYEQAHDVLKSCVTPLGFKASALPSGYPQVWARDSAITALGALVSGDDELIDCVRSSLETLGRAQTDLGMIHLNVDTRTGDVTTENAGAVDANLWFILAHYAYFETRQDHEFLRDSWSKIERAVTWLRYQDMNACGLLEVPEAGDWADLYSVRYNVLYDNVLYVASLRAAATMAGRLNQDGTPYRTLAADVKEKINLVMWLNRPWDGREFGEQLERLKTLRLEWFLLYQNTATLTEQPFFLPWVGFREFGNTFDGFGNMLAILLDIANQEQCKSILTHAHAAGANHPYPLKAFYPPIFPGDRDWREYFRSRNLNLPNQYHNGGIWPFLGGFYIAALVKAGERTAAEAQLTLLAEANRLGKTREWEFNEWIHGLSGRAMGHPLQAWSAAMFIFARYSLTNDKVPFFDLLT
jgi:GH15 family glucan-1,4-alpha-glucosidase